MTGPVALAGTIRTLGPGTLIVGTAGSTHDIATRCKGATVKWSSKADDAETMLSGDVIGGKVTYTAALNATVKQGDLAAGGLVDYTWANAGLEVPFSYTPYAGGRSVTGTLRIDPIDVGGDVKSKPESSIAWDIIGIPVLAAGL